MQLVWGPTDCAGKVNTEQVQSSNLGQLFDKIWHFNPSGYYMYRQFNIQQFSVLPTQRIYVFCVDLRTNSHYFPIQH